jgi:Leucine-rich repeat (LRR) protein
MKNINLVQIFVITMFVFQTNQLHSQTLDSLKNYKEYTKLEEALKEPDKVFRLNLNNQSFTEFPKGLSKFSNLEYLSLRNDHLTSLSPEIGSLKKLKVLDLGGNDFSVLPKDFTKLQNLEELYLDNDKNLDIQQDIEVLGKLPKLKILHLENDGIDKLPSNINKLEHLEQLYLTNNLFRVIPPQLKELKHLKYLDLNNNYLPNNLHHHQPQQYGLKIKF